MSNCAVAETSVKVGPESDPKQIIPDPQHWSWRPLKGLSHEIDFKTFDKNLHNLA